jgi:hypothetical protein
MFGHQFIERCAGARTKLVGRLHPGREIDAAVAALDLGTRLPGARPIVAVVESCIGDDGNPGCPPREVERPG